MAPCRGLRQDRAGGRATTCSKGKQVYLEGCIRYDEWTDKDGNKRNTTKIRVERAAVAPGPARQPRRGRRPGGRGGRRRRAARRAEGAGRPPADDFQVSTTTCRSSAIQGFRLRCDGGYRWAHGNPRWPYERFEPPYRYPQDEVTRWVQRLAAGGDATRRSSVGLLSAGVETARASVVPIERGLPPGDFETQNDRYSEIARREGGDLVRARSGRRPRSPADDVGPHRQRLLHRLHDPRRRRLRGGRAGHGAALLVRLPITESGCAGAWSGLARARDYLAAHPDQRRPSCWPSEFASLTFQRWDRSGHQRRLHRDLRGRRAPPSCLAGTDHPRGAGRRPGRRASSARRACSSRAPPT